MSYKNRSIKKYAKFKSTLTSLKINFRQISYTPANMIHLQYEGFHSVTQSFGVNVRFY